MEEETAIGREDITLTHLILPLADCRVEAYVGRLKHEVAVRGEENELYWSPLDRDFFDQTEFAGEGNIGHMVEQVKLCRGQLFEC